MDRVNGALILVFGILGFVFCPIFGLIAWSMGTNALRSLNEADIYDGSERGLANAGRILWNHQFVHLAGLFADLLDCGQRQKLSSNLGDCKFTKAYAGDNQLRQSERIQCAAGTV